MSAYRRVVLGVWQLTTPGMPGFQAGAAVFFAWMQLMVEHNDAVFGGLINFITAPFCTSNYLFKLDISAFAINLTVT
jgi:hypothetical protein